MVDMANPEEISKYRYALGKFMKAVETLATLSTQIKDRLFAAALDFAVISLEYMPEELHEDFAWVKGELTTGSQITYDAASEVAKRIVRIERELRIICDEIARTHPSAGRKPFFEENLDEEAKQFLKTIREGHPRK